MHKGTFIDHVRLEGLGRGNKNITADRMGEGGVKQDITCLLRNFLNFDFIEFIWPATFTFITVEQSAYNPWTDEPYDS